MHGSDIMEKPGLSLREMFSDPGNQVCPVDSQGNFFIDRDGHLFRYILSYLRTSEIVLPEDFKELQALKLEVEFYSLWFMRAILEDVDRELQ